MMFILMVFNDYDEQELIYIGFFNLIKDILEYTNHIIKYSDVSQKQRCYKTYKSLFKILKISNAEQKLYFS
jgi:choline kinase